MIGAYRFDMRGDAAHRLPEEIYMVGASISLPLCSSKTPYSRRDGAVSPTETRLCESSTWQEAAARK